MDLKKIEDRVWDCYGKTGTSTELKGYLDDLIRSEERKVLSGGTKWHLSGLNEANSLYSEFVKETGPRKREEKFNEFVRALRSEIVNLIMAENRE